MTTRRYVYTLTNRLSLLLLCVLAVTAGSLLIRYLTPAGYDYLDVLKRAAWPAWALAFVIRLVQWGIWRMKDGQP